MTEKITRDKIVKAIIRRINEYREDLVTEDARLGVIGAGPGMVSWVYDWLREEYDWAGMTMPDADEIKRLLKGDTVGRLADIAMAHCRKDAEREVKDQNGGAETKNVEVYMCNESENVGSLMRPKEMTRDEFLAVCGKFYDNRGTHFNDFERLSVRMRRPDGTEPGKETE